MKILKTVSFTMAAIGLLALPASADWRDRDEHHRHHVEQCGGPRWSIGIGFPLLVPPPAYTPPPPYYGEPAPVVGREVGVDVVVDAQRALARRGYYQGVIDGNLGPRCRAAIRDWQADCGLPMTGLLDARTLRSLALL